MVRRGIGAVLCALLLGGTATAAPARRAPASVILITVDTLRADRIGCYGYQHIQTPAIDGLCRDSIVFERGITQVPLTWPAHVAILTGTYPFYNGVQDFTGQQLRPDVATLPEAMKRRGYATGAVVSSFVLERSFGVARGFDFYYDTFKASSFLEGNLGLVDRPAGPSMDEALKWLKSARRPFFFWLHLYDPHSPYSPPEPFRTQYRQRPYDGEIAYADSQLERLFRWLKQARLYDSSLIILTSDHGEGLGDHDEREHGYFIYNTTVHVPLMVKPPAASRLKPRRETAAVETISIPATVLGLLGLHDPIEKQFQAPSLVPTPEDEAAPAFSETLYPLRSFGWSPLHSLQTRQYHYVQAPEPELYDLQADPGEQNNLAAERPAVAATLKQKLEERMLRFAPSKTDGKDGPSLSPDAASKLRALGYMAYRAPTAPAGSEGSLPDPKAKVEEFNAILHATDLIQVGDRAESQALLEALREKNPRLYLIPFLLAEGAIRHNDAAEASAQFRKALELNPEFDQAMLGLARALHALSQYDEARQWLDKALQYNPNNYRAWYQIAWIEMKQHRQATAVQALQKVLSIQPNFGLAYRDLGMLQIAQRDYAAAARSLSRSIQLGMEEAYLYNFLGIAYSQTGRLPAAIRSYRRALALDPNLAEAHLNLAASLTQIGQKAAAAPEFEAACRLKQDFCQHVPKRRP